MRALSPGDPQEGAGEGAGPAQARGGLGRGLVCSPQPEVM